MDDAQRELEKVQELLDGELQRAWAALLAHPGGKLIIWDILEMCGIYRSTYTGNAQSNFLEGERNIGLRIMNERILPNGVQAYCDILLEADARNERLRIAAQIDDAADSEDEE